MALTSANVVHGRGMVAKRAIAADEVLFEVHRSALLSQQTSDFGDVEMESDDGGGERASASEPAANGSGQTAEQASDANGDSAEQASDDEDDTESSAGASFGWAPLLFCMMAEYRLGAASSWAPYFEILPRLDQLPHPHFWPESTASLQALCGLDTRLQNDHEQMREQFDAYLPHFRRKFPEAIPADNGAPGE